MWPLETIERLNREATREARARHARPYHLTAPVLEAMRERFRAGHGVTFPFPYVGYQRPAGFHEVGRIFCDSSGWGSDSEPALNPRRLLARLRAGYWYAIGEFGQFQLYLVEYERKEPKR